MSPTRETALEFQALEARRRRLEAAGHGELAAWLAERDNVTWWRRPTTDKETR